MRENDFNIEDYIKKPQQQTVEEEVPNTRLGLIYYRKKEISNFKIEVDQIWRKNDAEAIVQAKAPDESFWVMVDLNQQILGLLEGYILKTHYEYIRLKSCNPQCSKINDNVRITCSVSCRDIVAAYLRWKVSPETA